MIQILSVQDERQRNAICKKAGIQDNDDLHIIAIHDDNDIVLEGAVFRFDSANGEILWLDMGDDIELADGLARAVFNIMEIRGVKTVSLPAEYNALAQKLSFKALDSHFEVSLDGYFCCGCQHK